MDDNLKPYRSTPDAYPEALDRLLRFMLWLTVAVVYCCLVELSYAAPQAGKASWYSQEACRYNPDPACPTASGQSLYQLEREGVAYAASWDYPFGTRLSVCLERQPSRCTEVVILDRGPARRLGRLIDLSRLAYSRLADLKTGVVRVTVEPVR